MLRFDTRPVKASCLETDFARLVKKVLTFMDPAAKALQKNSSGATHLLKAMFTKKSPIVSNAASMDYAELAPFDPSSMKPPPPPAKGENNSNYARVIVNP